MAVSLADLCYHFMLSCIGPFIVSPISHTVLLMACQEEVSRSISTFLISEDRGTMQGFAVGWHVAGELQASSALMIASSDVMPLHAHEAGAPLGSAKATVSLTAVMQSLAVSVLMAT